MGRMGRAGGIKWRADADGWGGLAFSFAGKTAINLLGSP